MAAPRKKTCPRSAESSSSEDEDLEKFKEAVWHMDGPKKTGGGTVQEPKPTRRLCVSDHQHDGNELDVTPEFRAHVAKKLEHMLDSVISEKPAGSASQSSGLAEDGDLGFKLFATSIQGAESEEAPRAVKRRPAPSSSDSDSEMDLRIREAAVSANDFLRPPPTVAERTLKEAGTAQPTERGPADPESPVLKKKNKKKKKKKASKCEEGSVANDAEDQNGHEESPHRKTVNKSSDKSASVSSAPPSVERSVERPDDKREPGDAAAKVRRKRKRKRKALDESSEA